MVTLSSISKAAHGISRVFTKLCTISIPPSETVAYKARSHPMSFSSPIAFVPHHCSLLPSVELRDYPYSAECKPPLTDKGPHRSTGDQVGNHHRRGRSSSILQDPKAMVMLSQFPPSFLDFFPLHTSEYEASFHLFTKELMTPSP